MIDIKKTLAKLLAIEEATLTLSSGWTWYQSSSAGKVYKWGRLAMVSLEVKPTSSKAINATEQQVATIPQGFRPLTSVGIVSLHQGSGTTFFMSRITTAGAVLVARLRDVANSNSGYTTASASHWFPITVVYIVGGVVRKLLNTLKMLTSERGWAVC